MNIIQKKKKKLFHKTKKQKTDSNQKTAKDEKSKRQECYLEYHSFKGHTKNRVSDNNIDADVHHI